MKRCLIVLSVLTWFSPAAVSQDGIPPELERPVSLRGLSEKDLTIPIDTAEQPNTNQCRLILPVVYNLMVFPSSSFGFMDRVAAYREFDLAELVNQLFKDINYFKETEVSSLPQFSPNARELCKIAAGKVRQTHINEKTLLEVFSADETEFLEKNLVTYFVSSETEDEAMNDIYKLNSSQDSAEAKSKRILDVLSRVNRDEIFFNSASDLNYFSGLFKFLLNNRNDLVLDGEVYTYSEDGITIAVGGAGNNSYKGRYDLIIDLGGDDRYETEGKPGLTGNFNCIIDLSGDDFYRTESDYSLASGMFSSGFIFDGGGNDTYRAGNMNLGAAVCGLAVIYDEEGSDIYEGSNFSLGAGMFGAGLIYDNSGNDFYIANSFSQGFGATGGIGAIVDKKGNDSYLISPVTIDVNRYSDHYLSMCQGYGFGLRPYYAGGIGYIIEGEGNDVYSCDVFGQGGSYWYSLGVIVDFSGNDKYSGFHYNQGSGIHYSVGLHKDYAGWDYYSSNWVSQGCGHDYAVGILWDVNGNDLYSCDGLSQGAGNANGIGILLDGGGRDGYLSKDNNTQGYGQPSRNFGSIGIFADVSGQDYYSQKGPDTSMRNYSSWGIRLDNYFPDTGPVTSPDEYKAVVDTNRSYTMDELYLFARTLETKFSKFAQFGFERLVRDSLNTAEYIFSRVGSADIRDVVLIRNLNSRIGYTIGKMLVSKLSEYQQNKPLYNTDETVFMCYLLGEAKYRPSAEILFRLTTDERYRVRASSVNALAKIVLASGDTELGLRLAEILVSLAYERSPRKLYNKEIAFAMKSIKDERCIPALIELMSNEYYGVRFLSSEALMQYNSAYSKYITDELILRICSKKIWLQAFLVSIENLPEDRFIDVIEKVLNQTASNDEVISSNIIELLNKRIADSMNEELARWLESKLIALRKRSIFEIE